MGTGPPNVPGCPKPRSSSRISTTLGAPCGALTGCGKSGLESLKVSPIFPLNSGSGMGRLVRSPTEALESEVCAKPVIGITARTRMVTDITNVFRFMSSSPLWSRDLDQLALNSPASFASPVECLVSQFFPLFHWLD